MLRVEMEVTERRLIPSTISLGRIRPQRGEICWQWKRRNRLAFRGLAEIGVSWWVLFPITANLRWRANRPRSTSPEVVAGQRSRRSISRVDDSRSTGDKSS